VGADAALAFRLQRKQAQFREGYLREQFALADADGSGYIDPEEFKVLCWKLHGLMSEEEIQTQLAKIDTDGDGRISFEEFRAWWTTPEMVRLQHEQSTRAGIAVGDDRWERDQDLQRRMVVKQREIEEARLRRTFARVDEDGSGVIEMDEFRRLARTLCATMTEEQMRATFEQIDADGSGGIDLDEFRGWWYSEEGRELRGEEASYAAAREELKQRHAAACVGTICTGPPPPTALSCTS
jgi:Ca2+-binding EF-hand superfamily protein